MANVTKNEKGLYQVNISHTKENMNRLVEEELERQEEKFFKGWECTNLGVLQGASQVDWSKFISGAIEKIREITHKPSETIELEEITKIMTEGKKENSGKIDYSEVDLDILDLMANRFNANKHKYPQGNMLKPIEEKELLFAFFRHLKKMIQPIDNDTETFEEHLAAILCNAQMVYQQRKLNNKLGYIK